MRISIVRCSALALAALLIGSHAAPAAAQWKWRDPSGQIQYSDRPPPASTPGAAILQRPGATGRQTLSVVPTAAAASAAASAAAPSARASEPELEARKRKAEQDEAARRKLDEARLAASRAENCSRARGQLRALDEGMRIARVNENGEREILDDDARAAETQRVRAIVEADCR